jgi:hypothetical protein
MKNLQFILVIVYLGNSLSIINLLLISSSSSSSSRLVERTKLEKLTSATKSMRLLKSKYDLRKLQKAKLNKNRLFGKRAEDYSVHQNYYLVV